MAMNKRKLSIAVAAALGVTAGGMGLSVPAFAEGEDLAALKAQLATLQAQVQRLEHQQADQATMQQLQTKVEALEQSEMLVPANVVTGGDKPGTFKLPGSDTSVQLGGYIKADVIYNFDSDLGDSLAASAIPTGGAPDIEGDDFRMHARQSRLYIKTWTPTSMGEMRTHWEGDFFTGDGNELVSNSRHFRVRHAYGALGPFLAGQTWSNFQNWHYGSTIDFGGPAGQIFARQAQVRYTFDISDNMSLAVAAENPESRTLLPDGTQINGKDEYPDFTGRFEWNNGDAGTSATVAGIIRGIKFDFGDLDNIDDLRDNSDTNYGITAGVTQNFGGTSLQLAGTYGEGLGRYLYYAFLPGGDSHINENGDVEATEVWGATASIGQELTPTLKANLVYGITDINLPDALYPTEARQFQTVHLNLQWRPVPRTTFGIEYQYAKRKDQDNDEGEANRLQFGAQYSF